MLSEDINHEHDEGCPANVVESIEKISNKVLAFQNYAMRRVWGLLFAFISVLVLVGSFADTLLNYITESDKISGLISGILFIITSILVILYWFKLFDRSLRIFQLRSSMSPTGSKIHSNQNRKLWRTSIVAVFLLYYISEIATRMFEKRLEGIVFLIVTLAVYVYLGSIMLYGLRQSFLRVPSEGYIVFSSLMLLVSLSGVASIINLGFAMENLFEGLAVFIGTSLPLICSISFIYHSSDFLEEMNEQ